MAHPDVGPGLFVGMQWGPWPDARSVYAGARRRHWFGQHAGSAAAVHSPAFPEDLPANTAAAGGRAAARGELYGGARCTVSCAAGERDYDRFALREQRRAK